MRVRHGSRSAGQTLLNSIEELANKGALDEAEHQCNLLMVNEDASAQVLCLCGVISEACGNQRHASELYRRAIDADPENYQAIIHLAAYLEAQGDDDEAALLRTKAKGLATRKG